MKERARTCGAACYAATEPLCACICGGAFHGKAGEANRKAILQAVGALPRNEGEMLLLRNAAQRITAIRGERPLKVIAGGKVIGLLNG